MTITGLRSRRRRVIWGGLALATALLFASCTDDDEAPSSTDAPSTTQSPSTSDAPSTTQSPTTSAIPASTSQPPSTGGAPSTTSTALEPGVRTFTVDDGLPTNAVVNVDVNEDGTTWALVHLDEFELTLARLDGDRWTQVDPPATIFGTAGLAAGPDGTAWLIGDGFVGPTGLWEYDGEEWTTHLDCTPEGVEQDLCQREATEASHGAVGGDGQLWATGFFSDGEDFDCGFLLREGDGWRSFPATPNPGPEGFTLCPQEGFAPDSHPHLLLDDGLYRLDEDGWTNLTDGGNAPAFEEDAIFTWAVGADGTAWANLYDIEEASPFWERFDGNEWTTLPIGTEGLQDIEIDRACVLLGNPDYDPTSLDRLLADPVERATFVSGRLAPLGVDPDGNVVTAIRCSGVAFTDPDDGSIARTITTDDGLPSLRINDLEVGPDGEVWVATDDGVTRFVF